MNSALDFLMICIVVMNFALLTSSRIFACIRFVAFQGIVTGLLPLFVHDTESAAFISAITIILKGVIFPIFLFRALKRVAMKKEVEPLIGYTFSLIAGIVMLVVSLWLSSRIASAAPIFSEWVVQVSFFTMLVGLFVIMTRVKAITQVLGFIVMENGIYLFGFAFLLEQPFLVELGILLDVFVAVFVMGIIIFHINREFDHINIHELTELHD